MLLKAQHVVKLNNGKPYSKFGEMKVVPSEAWKEASKAGKFGLGVIIEGPVNHMKDFYLTF